MNKDNFYMWLGCIKGMNNSKLNALIEYSGSAEEIYKAESRELLAAADTSLAENIIKARKTKSPEKLMEELDKSGAKYIANFDENFPEGLKNIDDVPIGIYYKGILPARNSRLVSMVGSRRCTEYGRMAALKIAGDLADNGILIVSGMAAGIDSYSHEGALRHKGLTAAVFGTAIDKCYPPENRSLMERIIENNGCVISEYGPGQATYGTDFVKRNRIIAGMSEVLIVVEAEIKSGTNSTVDDAIKYNRSVFAVPGSILSKYSEGTNALIRDGCPPVSSYKDILLEMGIDEKPCRKTKNKKEQSDIDGVSENGRLILAALDKEALDFDTLAAETGIQESRLRTELTLLEIRKLIMKLPGQRYRLIL